VDERVQLHEQRMQRREQEQRNELQSRLDAPGVKSQLEAFLQSAEKYRSQIAKFMQQTFVGGEQLKPKRLPTAALLGARGNIVTIGGLRAAIQRTDRSLLPLLARVESLTLIDLGLLLNLGVPYKSALDMASLMKWLHSVHCYWTLGYRPN
jgi:hypothetical protein